MNRFGALLIIGLIAIFCFGTPCNAQCAAPEVVKGADKYNEILCMGVKAEKSGDEEKALKLFLDASQEPVLESPNILLFGRIAKAYALIGKFQEAHLYLEYDNTSLLWQLGVVRCQAQPSSDSEVLLQDGKLLESREAKHMSDVLCGEIFDNDADFSGRDASSFAPTARAILRHESLRKEIDNMRLKQQPARR